MSTHMPNQSSTLFHENRVSRIDNSGMESIYPEMRIDLDKQKFPNFLQPAPFDRETSFVEFCASLMQRMPCDRSAFADFPLQGKLRLRSNISLAFGAGELQDISVRRVENGTETTLWLNILTLGGGGGVLPLQISEDILRARRHGGDALHQFLDLINRRFWEILFQSYRIGTRPQFGFNNPTARWLIHDLAKNAVGFGNTAANGGLTANSHQSYLLRYCFNVGHGSGTSDALAELLSRGIEQQVRIVERESCHALIPRRHSCCLHGPAAVGVARSFGMLGRRAVVRKLRILDIQGAADNLYLFLPIAVGRLLQVALQLLTMALAGEFSLVALRYRASVKAGESCRLGEAMLRLAWGGALGTRGDYCNLIYISSAAIAESGKLK